MYFWGKVSASKNNDPLVRGRKGPGAAYERFINTFQVVDRPSLSASPERLAPKQLVSKSFSKCVQQAVDQGRLFARSGVLRALKIQVKVFCGFLAKYS